MTALVFATQAEADAYAAKVDAAYGYPKPGVNVGGGIHVPAEQSRTLRHDNVLEKPVTKDAWAYPVDAAVLAKEPAPAGKTATTLDASWDGAKVAEPVDKGDADGGAK